MGSVELTSGTAGLFPLIAPKWLQLGRQLLSQPPGFQRHKQRLSPHPRTYLMASTKVQQLSLRTNWPDPGEVFHSDPGALDGLEGTGLSPEAAGAGSVTTGQGQALRLHGGVLGHPPKSCQ